MGSLIYVAVIIIIAVISSLNKAAKGKGKSSPRGGMPTFGGGEGNPLRRTQRPERQPDEMRPPRVGSGFPVPGGGSSYSGRPAGSAPQAEYEASPAWPESPLSPSPDYGTGEGMSLEQSWSDDGVQARAERMQRELEQLQAQFDGSAAAVPAGNTNSTKKAGTPAAASTVRSGIVGDREALRNGLVWSEILGPPRARRPHSSRR